MFLNNLTIGRKIALAFTAVFLAIAVMGSSVYISLQTEKSAGEARATAVELGRTVSGAEFYMARQENSYRGFLISNDPYYLGRLNAHRANFKKKMEAARGLGGPDVEAQVDVAEQQADAWFDNIVTAGTNLVKDPSRRAEAQAMVGRDGSADKFIDPVEGAIDTLKLIAEAKVDETRKAQERATLYAEVGLMIGLAITGLVAILAGWAVSRGIARPVTAMTQAMRRLASGDTEIAVPGVGRGDEVGQMAGAVVAFRDAAIANSRLQIEAEEARLQTRLLSESAAERQAGVVSALAEALDRLSAGDLTYQITRTFPEDYEKLKIDFNAAMIELAGAMGTVSDNAGAIRSGAGEISHAADDLSRRTEQQAANLEETAAALDQITATVATTAQGARQASDTVVAAKSDAETSGKIVRDAVEAMGAIEKSAKEISQIIGVIDEIAFQTNLLALNAGVEAARAGDAGRGFAVVAQEVRALAQRSAEAAKEIKALIASSSQQVGTGVQLVAKTGDALSRIVGRVSEIDGLIAQIAASAQEQATGLTQVNTAMNQMDQMTQQNAAMVEQSTAASHSLAREADALAGSISRFQLNHTSAAVGGEAPVRYQPRNADRPAVRPSLPRQQTVVAMRTTGNGGAARKTLTSANIDEAGWEEF